MSINARDIAQRSIGCIGFSALAHSTLLVALLLAPKSASDLGISAIGKQNLSESEGSVEVINAPNPAPAPAAAPTKEVEQAAVIPAPAPAPVSEEKPLPKKVAAVAPLPKAVKAKVAVKAASAPKIKTTADSDVVTEVKDKNVELENLSPVIAEEPMAPSSDDAITEAPAAASAAPAAPAPAPAPTQETAPAAAAPATTEKAPEPQAATESKPAHEKVAEAAAPKESAAVASDEGSGKGKATSSGTGSAQAGSGSGSGEAAGTGSAIGDGKVIEASLRRPLPGNQLPQYPRQDRFMRRQGTSIVLGDVRHDGTVENVRLERSSGSKEMDTAALSVFKKWKFAPGAEATVRKSFQYALQGPEQVSYSGLKR